MDMLSLYSFSFFLYGVSINKIIKPYYNHQIQMLSSIKSGCSKLKRLLKRAGSFISRKKGTIFKIFLFLAVVAMIVSLVMESVKGVDVLSQAVIINTTEQKIYDGDYTN